MTLKQRGVALLLVSALFVVGCGGATGGADSPQAVFNNFKSAVENNDWETATAQLTEETQTMFAGGMIMAAGFTLIFEPEGAESKKESFDAVLAKHGLDNNAMDNAPEVDADDPAAAMKELLAPVDNKPALVADIMTWMKDNLGEGGEMVEEVAEGELKNVEINGDTAKGVISFTKDGNTNEQPIEFRRVNGKWFIQMPMN